MAARQGMSRELLSLGLALLGLAAGCADDGVSLHVICPIVPEVSDDGCTWDSQSEVCVADGVLNVDSASYYRLNLKVESGLKPREREVPPVAEPNGMQMTRARVELRAPSGEAWAFPQQVIDGAPFPALDNPITITASGYVEPGGAVIVPLSVIGADYIQRLAASRVQQVVVAVQISAKTNGSQNIDSAEYAWPVRLIKASPRESDRQCSPDIPVCQGSLGQDGFAFACSETVP